jgi:ABC-type lipoprotein release transport system permease subunit
MHRYIVTHPHLLGGAVLFALIVSMLSSVYRASRAASIDPIQALRAEQT